MPWLSLVSVFACARLRGQAAPSSEAREEEEAEEGFSGHFLLSRSTTVALMRGIDNECLLQGWQLQQG